MIKDTREAIKAIITANGITINGSTYTTPRKKHTRIKFFDLGPESKIDEVVNILKAAGFNARRVNAPERYIQASLASSNPKPGGWVSIVVDVPKIVESAADVAQAIPANTASVEETAAAPAETATIVETTETAAPVPA